MHLFSDGSSSEDNEVDVSVGSDGGKDKPLAAVLTDPRAMDSDDALRLALGGLKAVLSVLFAIFCLELGFYKSVKAAQLFFI